MKRNAIAIKSPQQTNDCDCGISLYIYSWAAKNESFSGNNDIKIEHKSELPNKERIPCLYLLQSFIYGNSRTAIPNDT